MAVHTSREIVTHEQAARPLLRWSSPQKFQEEAGESAWCCQPSPQLPASQPWLSCRGRCCSLCNTTFCACSLAPYKSLRVSQQPFQPFKAACSYSSRKSLQLGFNKSVVLYILEKKSHSSQHKLCKQEQ